MSRRTLRTLCILLVVSLAAACSIPQPPERPPAPYTPLEPVAWSEVDGWPGDDPVPALNAFRRSCLALGRRAQWEKVCSEAAAMEAPSPERVRDFFQERFIPYRLRGPDGSPVGMATGYYVPDLSGSRQPSPDYPYPLYRRPDDMLAIDLGDVYPELAGYRLRGRVDGRRVVPYWDRAAIDGDKQPLAGSELLWVEDPVELFFLHIQGSGRIHFEDGSSVMVNYADQNGHPYRSLSSWLIERDIMTPDQMSMQNIKQWARQNPERVGDLLGSNPSYIFFVENRSADGTPPGAMGVPLTSGRSVAVDRRYTPLGAPVFLSTTWPDSDRPLKRLMMAQDTGGAIKGPVRADFFWGMGAAAGAEAGRMKQALRMWVLLPVE